MDKLSKLKNVLAEMGRALVAYSGGVDSTLVLKVAKDVLGDDVLAVIADSPVYPEEEIAKAVDTAKKLGAEYMVIRTNEMADENFVQNSQERCYHCKRGLFTELKRIARERGYTHIIDGSNHDDRADFRPGNKAKEEFRVSSPLQEAGLTKLEIREVSKELGLPTWDKPSMACLASRIPYGMKITDDILERVREGESFLKDLGFQQTRVRHHDAIARIEVEPEALTRMMEKNIIDAVNKKFEELGYAYVTLDLKGFRTGSLNEIFKEKPKDEPNLP